MYRETVITELVEMGKLLANQIDRMPASKWKEKAESEIRYDALAKAAIVLAKITDLQFRTMISIAERETREAAEKAAANIDQISLDFKGM